MKITTLLFSFLTLLCFNSHAQTDTSFRYQDGDLIFQDLDCGSLCDAIEKVTHGYHDKHFSHVGMIERAGDQVWVIEAIGARVHKTLLDSMLLRSHDAQGHPKVIIGRVAKPSPQFIKRALLFANDQIGKPYDAEFLPDNGKYYCSELIYDAFRTANNGKALFPMHPMTFIDPDTKAFFPAWVEYYHELHRPIPEGTPGCNPGGLSTDPAFMIVKELY